MSTAVIVRSSEGGGRVETVNSVVVEEGRRILYPAAALVLYLCLQRGYTEESLLVIRSLGVQTSTTAGTWVGQGRRTRFIPTEKVRDVLVNEGFWGLEVRFYLAVVAEGEGGLVVVFPVTVFRNVREGRANAPQTLLPNRRICEQVWRGAKRCLYQPETSTIPLAASK